MATVSIIIPIHNRLLITQEGLHSLFNALYLYESNGNKKVQYKVIVIDDGSTDGSSEWIAKNYPQIHILKGNGNLWWSGAINLGSKHAINKLNSDYLLLWNDDTICDIYYFNELEKIINNTYFTNTIIVSKIYWYEDPEILFNFGCFYNKNTGLKKINGLNEKGVLHEESFIEVDWSGGMGTLIPKEVMIKNHYFNASDFPQYHSDIDFCLRAKKNGFRIFALSNLKIWNRKDSTGIKKANSLRKIKALFFTNNSLFNIEQNFYFNQYHSNTFLSWAYFLKQYINLFLKSILNILT